MPSENQVSGLLHQWDVLRAQGDEITPEELCRDCPELLPALQQKITAIKAVEKRMRGDESTGDYETPDYVPSQPPADLPAVAGRYQLQHEIARGGMGVVVRAIDPEFNRSLAVKIVLSAPGARPEMEQRFFEEARITGCLQHPGIAPVHDMGRLSDGRPFFAMKLIEGRTLAELLKRRKSDEEDPNSQIPTHYSRLTAIFEQICQTLAYAHSQGVIHRDLKPANIMVGAFGEVQVMDWGLAKRMKDEGGRMKDGGRGQNEKSEEPTDNPGANSASSFILHPSSFTKSGVAMGTPAFMPPEQARGEIRQLDERSDVFGLGAILCVILTKIPPFYADTSDEIIRLAQAGDLTDAYARLDQCGGDVELIELCKACLAPVKEHRPRDAGEVAAAVTAYQEGVQEKLRQAEIERARAQTKAAEEKKRRRIRRGLAAAILALIALSAAGAWWYQRETAMREATRAARLAVTERKVSDALEVAKALREMGWKQTDELERWRSTLREAFNALERAEGILAAGETTDELRARVSAVRTRLEEADRDQLLAVDIERNLVKILQERKGSQEYQKAARRFAQIFKKRGIDMLGFDRKRAIHWLRTHPLKKHLLVALQAWSVWTDENAHRKRIIEILSAVDPDTNANYARWTMAFLTRDRTAMAALSADPQVAEMSPSVLVLMGMALYVVGDPDTAFSLLKQGRTRHPDDFWLNLGLGILLQKMEPSRTEQAIPYLMTAVALRKENAEAYALLGDAFQRVNNFPAAMSALRKAVDLDPNYARAHFNLGLAYRLQDKLDLAIHHYQKAIHLEPEWAVVHTFLANAYRFNNQLDLAIESYDKAIEIDPDYAMAYNNLGLAYEAKKKRELAVRLYEKAIDVDPAYASPYYNLGLVYGRERKLDSAIKHFKKAVDLKANWALAHNKLGYAYRLNNQIDLAIQHLETAVALDPNDATARNNLGLVYRLDGQVDKAIKHLEKAVELDPMEETAHNNLGYAYRLKNKLDLAVKHLLKAIDLKYEYAIAHNNLGLVYRLKNRLSLAIKHGKTAIDLKPKYASAHFNLGYAYRLNHQLDLAITHYRLAIDVDPKWAKAHNNLGHAHRLKGEWNLAVKHLQKAIDLKPNYTIAHHNLGLVYRHQNKLHLAIKHLRRAIELEPKKAIGRYDAACVAVLAATGEGKVTQALKQIEQMSLRRQALDWLKAEVQAMEKLLNSKPQAAPAIEKDLRHAQSDSDLAGVRDEKALDNLPKPEREEWRKLWDGVESLRRKAKMATDPDSSRCNGIIHSFLDAAACALASSNTLAHRLNRKRQL